MKNTPKILKKIILVGVAITVIAIAFNVISGAINHQKLLAQFAKAEGKLIVESNKTYDDKVVAYLENERSGESCAAKTVGHDDAWIYSVAWCLKVDKEEGLTTSQELQGKFGYKLDEDKITSSQFIGKDGINPTIQSLIPYDAYLQYQKEIDNKILDTLNSSARTREATKN